MSRVSSQTLGGAAPFGYRWVGQRLVPELREARIRKFIYELFFEHKRRKVVARLLNECGYRTRSGSLFTDTTVERLLRDPTAMGVHRANYTRSRGERRPWAFKPKYEWVVASCPAIVSQELWEACNTILAGNRVSGRKVGRPAVHPFTGLAFCDCGEKLYVPWQSPSYVCYICRNKIQKDHLEALFRDQLKDLCSSLGDAARNVARLDQALRRRVGFLERLQAELAKIQTAMARLHQNLEAGDLSMRKFEQRYQPLEVRRERITRKLPGVQGEVDFLWIATRFQADSLVEAGLPGCWSSLTVKERRQIVEAVVRRVVVGRVDVCFDFLLPHSR